MLRIWGRLSSINVRKVVLAAQWLGIPFERIDAGGVFGGVTTPDFLARNPNAMVPLIDDEGFTLWESNVIVRYLCAKHSAGGLYPATLQARFDAERWMDWQQTTLNPAGRSAFIQLIRVAPDKRDAAALSWSIAQTEPLLDMLETKLATQPHISGDQFGMADIPIACEIHRWLGLPLEHKSRPALAYWYSNIAGRHAARGVLDLPLS
ncbi:MAG: glutathione S-transferase [Ramlibacter sp.]|nr:glutathione S-transferase [Ramlibacter sp.]